MEADKQDQRIRTAAFEWLAEQVRIHGDVLPRRLLGEGFWFDGAHVPLVGPQGIFKPKLFPHLPLSITTSPGGPYDDGFGADGLLMYRYRGNDPGHHENVGLRDAMECRTPLVYFHGIVKGKYLAAWPVYIVGDSPGSLSFTVAVDDARSLGPLVQQALTVSEPQAEMRRAYVTATVRQKTPRARACGVLS